MHEYRFTGNEGTIMVTIERLTESEAESRRAEILDSVQMSADDLLGRAARYELDADTRALALEYERLTFLLTGA